VIFSVFSTISGSVWQDYISENSPEGVVHNYVLAILNKDYEKAYGYLAELEYKPTYEEFRRPFLNGYVNPDTTAVDVGISEISGDEASVEISQIYNQGDPFSSGYRDTQRAILVKQNGAWKLSNMPAYNFWDYSWYTEVPK